MSTTQIEQLRRFSAKANKLGLGLPESVRRALHVIDVANKAPLRAPVDVLQLTDKKIYDEVVTRTVHNIPATRNGAYGVSGGGLAAGIESIKQAAIDAGLRGALPELDGMIEQLRPQFDEHARHFVAAAQDYGFSLRTRTDAVVDLEDNAAVDLWRACRDSWGPINEIAQFRNLICTAFELAPYETEYPGANLDRTTEIDFSVNFAAGDNWDTTGVYYVDGRIGAHINWFQLAKGGLRLNTISEVNDKSGDAPGLDDVRLDPPDELQSFIDEHSADPIEEGDVYPVASSAHQ